MNKENKIQGKLVGLFIVLIAAVNASAYVDAGTGSYFIQVLIAFVAAGLLSIKLFWNRIWMFIKSIGKGSRNDKPEN